jgi:hypothetical protein
MALELVRSESYSDRSSSIGNRRGVEDVSLVRRSSAEVSSNSSALFGRCNRHLG